MMILTFFVVLTVENNSKVPGPLSVALFCFRCVDVEPVAQHWELE